MGTHNVRLISDNTERETSLYQGYDVTEQGMGNTVNS